MTHLILKPFQGSKTGSLLVSQPEGVFHLTDNVLLFAQAVTGVPYPTSLKLVRLKRSVAGFLKMPARRLSSA